MLLFCSLVARHHVQRAELTVWLSQQRRFSEDLWTWDGFRTDEWRSGSDSQPAFLFLRYVVAQWPDFFFSAKPQKETSDVHGQKKGSDSLPKVDFTLQSVFPGLGVRLNVWERLHKAFRGRCLRSDKLPQVMSPELASVRAENTSLRCGVRTKFTRLIISAAGWIIHNQGWRKYSDTLLK